MSGSAKECFYADYVTSVRAIKRALATALHVFVQFHLYFPQSQAKHNHYDV